MPSSHHDLVLEWNDGSNGDSTAAAVAMAAAMAAPMVLVVRSTRSSALILKKNDVYALKMKMVL